MVLCIKGIDKEVSLLSYVASVGMAALLSVQSLSTCCGGCQTSLLAVSLVIPASRILLYCVKALNMHKEIAGASVVGFRSECFQVNCVNDMISKAVSTRNQSKNTGF